MTVDERIEDFGFKLVSHNDITGIFIYENQDYNQRVWLLVTKPYGQKLAGYYTRKPFQLMKIEQCR